MPTSLEMAAESARSDEDLKSSIGSESHAQYLSVKEKEVEYFSKMTDEERRLKLIIFELVKPCQYVSKYRTSNQHVALLVKKQYHRLPQTGILFVHYSLYSSLMLSVLYTTLLDIPTQLFRLDVVVGSVWHL
jgi:hypothetical protein